MVCYWLYSQTTDLARPLCVDLHDMSGNDSAQTTYDELDR